jgi:hypothetical protein
MMINQNNPHPIKNAIGEIFDHFLMVMVGGMIGATEGKGGIGAEEVTGAID